MANKLSSLFYEIKRRFQAEYFRAGHYYSAVPSITDLKDREKQIFKTDNELKDIKLNTSDQLALLQRFVELSEQHRFYDSGKEGRFNIENNSFSYDDAPILHYLIRALQPKRIIEVGSGNSSACMVDTSEKYLAHDVEFTFIDIDCTNLRKNLRNEDLVKVKIIESPVQSVNKDIFSTLQQNDILFIDSSHVSKIGSDLHTIIFEVLPALNPGVVIHFHDIRFPFEYRRELVMNRIFWNEAYLLRALLQNNDSYRIIFWLNYLINTDEETRKILSDLLPLEKWDDRFNGKKRDYSGAGGSIYLQKIQ